MAYSNIKADLTGLVAELNKYSDDVMNEIDKAADKIAREARKELIATSPYREEDAKPRKRKRRKKVIESEEPVKKKHYRDSWKTRKNKHKTRFGMSAGIQIISASKPHLTHLLENGHRVVLPQGHSFKNGKRQVSAKKHIQPVQEQVNAKLLIRVDEILRKHGK